MAEFIKPIRLNSKESQQIVDELRDCNPEEYKYLRSLLKEEKMNEHTIYSLYKESNSNIDRFIEGIHDEEAIKRQPAYGKMLTISWSVENDDYKKVTYFAKDAFNKILELGKDFKSATEKVKVYVGEKVVEELTLCFNEINLIKEEASKDISEIVNNALTGKRFKACEKEIDSRSRT